MRLFFQRLNAELGGIALGLLLLPAGPFRMMAAQADGGTPPPTASPSLNAVVRISPAEAFHDRPLVATLESSVPEAMLRWTQDGSEPTGAHGEIYRGPITLRTTTPLRVAAFVKGIRVSRIATRTYLFPDQILQQPDSPAGFPAGSDAWNDFPSAYKMDPRVVTDPACRDEMKPALRALPTVSVVCPLSDLFGAGTGLYLHTRGRGEDWEKRCSLEWIDTNGLPAFQVDCGLRIQGNYGRLPEKTPKHSFRLLFKTQYGVGKLHYPVFPDSKVQKFDSLVLRADYNNSWTHWQPQDQVRAQRTRDAWLKDSHRAMGWLAPHNRYVHLYLNGLYWGIYDLAERPDAAFAAANLGGSKEEFDVVDESGVKSGDRTAFAALLRLGRRQNPPSMGEVAAQLDLVEWMDYLLLNFYAGNGDWGEHKNWYAVRRRAAGEQFRYFVWDGEMILQGIRDDEVNNPGRPPFRLFKQLDQDPEFQLAFADRVQRHCFGRGALTPEACAERWMARASELRVAILAESARWGYYRREFPFTRDSHWLAEQRRLIQGYFPRRTKVLIKQLQMAGLYPMVEAPVLIRAKPGEGPLSFKPAEGMVIHYTLDGTDPRQSGTSQPSPQARRYAEAISLPGDAHGLLKARAFSGGVWSALVEEPF